MQKTKIRDDKIQKAITKSSFIKWYKEYQFFVLSDKLPNISIVPFCNTETPQCYVERINNKNIINVNQLLIPVYGQQCTKTIAFHEFTHVFDNEFLFPEIPYEVKKEYIWGYSEYHATFIEMLCALQFKYICDNPKVELTSIIYIDRPTTLEEYLLKNLYDMKVTLETYFKNANCDTMIEVLRFLSYSFARIDFLNKYCPEALKIYDVEQLFINKLGEGIIDLHSLFTNIELNNINNFKGIIDMQVKITGDYLTKLDKINQ